MGGGGWGEGNPNREPVNRLRLMGRLCRWMGSHFHDWIEYSGVAFSKELLEWGRTFSDFWGKRVVHIYG